MTDHSVPARPKPDDIVTVSLPRGDLEALLTEVWVEAAREAPAGVRAALAALRTASLHGPVAPSGSVSPDRPVDEALQNLAAFLRDGQRWRAGRLVSSSCPSQADICAALGWPPPWNTAWAPAAPHVGAKDNCMPHQRFSCGHCPHDLCQVCERCCSCRCRQEPMPST
ncbi:hypothetical protein ACF09H_22245 [Streptomyces sp. NPDC014983]|uniref:hypothetical protein n=1 Tax=Streptomyces sp. NPDC014983 TaxID=3364933 RepID=UPI0036FD7829